MPPDRPRFAKKRFGQHFLERPWVDKILRAIEPEASETFIEIGPGCGALTRPLAAAVGRVVAFEIDRDLAFDLRGTPHPIWRSSRATFWISPRTASGTGWRTKARRSGARARRREPSLQRRVPDAVQARSSSIATASRWWTRPSCSQREVADRLVASPGTREYGASQRARAPRRRRQAPPVASAGGVPPGAERPLRRRPAPVSPRRAPCKRRALVFEKLTQAIFTRRRKTLTNALLAYPPSSGVQVAEVLRHAGLDGRRRPETLEIAESRAAGRCVLLTRTRPFGGDRWMRSNGSCTCRPGHSHRRWSCAIVSSYLVHPPSVVRPPTLLDKAKMHTGAGEHDVTTR